MSTPAKQMQNRRTLQFAAAIGLPIVVMALYLIASRTPVRWFTAWSDYLGVGVAIASGAFFVWKLVPHPRWRTLALLAYALACAGMLFIFSVVFVCAAFGDCL